MKFRNPWVDPRVLNVHPAQAQAYLLKRGWKPLPEERRNFSSFDGFCSGDDKPVVHVPTLEGARDYAQRVIELITDIAIAEQRYAADVLSDVLKSDTSSVPVNGSVPHPVADNATM